LQPAICVPFRWEIPAVSRIDHLIEAWQFNRVRTLGLLDRLEQETNPAESLAWQPGPGRAHIAWQLMHIGITDELFATERLRPEKITQIPDLLPRYKVGSTPDQNIPTPAEIRETLASTRENLLDTIRTFDDSQLDWISPALAPRRPPHPRLARGASSGAGAYYAECVFGGEE
jgi:hypothetical protein